MAQVNFGLCPMGTLQYRIIEPRPDDQRTKLWRTWCCGPNRWHYWENPCRCASILNGPGFTAFDCFRAGYAIAEALPVTGTWRRDARSITSWTAAFRAQIKLVSGAEAAARAAMGPQLLRYVGDYSSGWWFDEVSDIPRNVWDRLKKSEPIDWEAALRDL